MQSGISASEELRTQFQTLLSSADTFALLVAIKSESLVPVTKIAAASSSATFKENLSKLQAHIKPDAAQYYILHRFETAPAFVAVTYVPDAAPVRQKMLFASTRLTLVRELGMEHFRDTLFVTQAEELTERGLDKHDSHTSGEAPLTQEERELGAVKRAEQEAGSGTRKRDVDLSKSMDVRINEDVTKALCELSRGESRTVAMLVSKSLSRDMFWAFSNSMLQRINPETEMVELVPDSPRPNSIDELSQAISATEPRFTFYRFIHTHEWNESRPVLFFYTWPSSQGEVTIKIRMMYPLMKRAVLKAAEDEAGLVPDKQFQVEKPSEITEKMVMDELHPKVAARQGFRRPPRPRR